jgi:hypothetical protein
MDSSSREARGQPRDTDFQPQQMSRKKRPRSKPAHDRKSQKRQWYLSPARVRG